MQVKDIITVLDSLNNIKIIQMDSFDNEIAEDEIFYGSVMDVPWYIIDYYLDNDHDGEALGVSIDKETKEAYFLLYVYENSNHYNHLKLVEARRKSVHTDF